MTSKVVVTAHCGSNKQVRVTRGSANCGEAPKILQDGESVELSIYDDLVVSAKEELKPVEQVDQASAG